MAPELTRAVTNVVCSLCFNSSYRRGDPEFEAMLEYSQGIVDTVAKESLVDIFPWLQVSGSIANTWAFSFWNRGRGWNASSHVNLLGAFLPQIFPNRDLALLKRCLKVRDQLLQQKFTEHKVLKGQGMPGAATAGAEL